MKTRERNIKETIYICEICLQEFNHESLANKCEVEHERKKCKHKNIKYEIELESMQGDSSANAAIYRSCSECNLYETKEFVNLEDYTSQALLKKIWKDLM